MKAVSNNEVKGCDACDFMAVKAPPEGVDIRNIGTGDIVSPDSDRDALLFRIEVDVSVCADSTSDRGLSW